MSLPVVTAFGLRALKVANADGSGAVALPASMLLHFVEEVGREHFQAEGVTVGAVAWTQAVRWELEAGGVPLAVWAKLTGRTVAEAGSAPNRTLTLSAGSGQPFPYVQIFGKSVGDRGDDIHCKLYRAKLTDLEGTFREGEFYVASCAGIAVNDAAGRLYEFVQHESETDLS